MQPRFGDELIMGAALDEPVLVEDEDLVASQSPARCSSPPILIMDEAVSNLDAASEREVAAAMARAREGRTTLIIVHRLSTIRTTDRIVVLNDGHVAEVGTHDELLARSGTYATLLASQLDRMPTGREHPRDE